MKRRLRRGLFIGLPVVLLGVFFVLQALSLLRLYQVQQDKQLQATGDNLLWVVSQAQVASQELRYQVSRYALQGTGRQPLSNSYQVFLSRLQLMREGPQWRQMAALGLQDALQDFSEAEPLLRQQLEQLQPQEARVALQVEALLQPLEQQLARAVSRAMVLQWDNLGQELEVVQRQLRHTFLLMLAILAVGTQLGLSLVLGRRRAWQQAWQLRKEKALSQHVLGSSIAAVIVVDRAMCCTVFNPAAVQLFGRSVSAMRGRRLTDMIAFFAQARLEAALQQAIDGKSRIFQECRYQETGMAEAVYLELRISALRDGQDEILGAIIVAHDVTEQQAAQRELALHRNHLEQLVRDRTLELKQALERERNAAELYQHFAAMVSHQFRTPLAIVDSSLQRLMRRADRLTATEVRSRVERARTAVKRLTRLVGSTLGAARLDAGQIDTCPEACDLVQLVAGVREQQRDEQDDCRIELHAPEVALAWCDPVHVEHIVGNLIGNACKYATTAQAIEVGILLEPDSILCRITNPGHWPDDFEPERAFELYWRAEHTGSTPGLGIGLYMARELARLQGGELSLDQTRAGWVTLVLRLPAAGSRAGCGVDGTW